MVDFKHENEKRAIELTEIIEEPSADGTGGYDDDEMENRERAARVLRFADLDDQATGLSLGDRFRSYADGLDRARRSPLYVHMMRAAADDIDAGGTIAALLGGVPVSPGSVPQLRLLAALHHLVLSGEATELSEFYPSVGGYSQPEGVWPAALRVVREHAAWIKQRLGRNVQTNDPGRAAVLFIGLLWLAVRYRRPIRLLEPGASAGLNLLADHYCYISDGHRLGNPSSAVCFREPWDVPPALDLRAAAHELQIVHRCGCDLVPLDPADGDDQRALLSFVWPDELDRFNRTQDALKLAASAPGRVVAQPAAQWLPNALAGARDGELTVIWSSLLRQYLAPYEWAALQDIFAHANGDHRRPIVWLSMEASSDHVAKVQLTLRTHPGNECSLATCDDHGPPITWEHAD